MAYASVALRQVPNMQAQGLRPNNTGVGTQGGQSNVTVMPGGAAVSQPASQQSGPIQPAAGGGAQAPQLIGGGMNRGNMNLLGQIYQSRPQTPGGPAAPAGPMNARQALAGLLGGVDTSGMGRRAMVKQLYANSGLTPGQGRMTNREMLQAIQNKQMAAGQAPGAQLPGPGTPAAEPGILPGEPAPGGAAPVDVAQPDPSTGLIGTPAKKLNWQKMPALSTRANA